MAGFVRSFLNLTASSPAFRLLAGTAFSVVLPTFLRLQFDVGWPASGSAWNTIVGTLGAVAIGFGLLETTTRFAQVRSATYVVPCFATTFGGLVLAFFFLRLDYTRSILLASFVIALLWFFFCAVIVDSRSRKTFALSPFGSTGSLKALTGANFIVLDRPEAPVIEVDAMIVDLRADLPPEWEKFIADWVLAERPVYHVKHAWENLTGRVDIEHLSENSFGTLDPGRAYRKLKASADVLVAVLLLPLFALLVLLVGLAIRLDSKGPVLYRQERIGYGGRTFSVYKFRTMRFDGTVSLDDRAAAMTADRDERVTRVGRFLRRTRIDEMPQLINVLKGEMSWIGPRPEAAALSRWYEGELPFYPYRHVVRPGITGWAQVNQGHVVQMDDVLGKLHYDFYYIKYFSLSLDILIAFRTGWVMLRGIGSK